MAVIVALPSINLIADAETLDVAKTVAEAVLIALADADELDAAVQVAEHSRVASDELVPELVAKTVPAPETSIIPDAEMLADAAAVADASSTEPSNPKLKSPNSD